MTMMTQDTADALLEILDVHNRLKNAVSGLIVIADHAGPKSAEGQALCHAANGIDHELRRLKDLIYAALGRNLADEDAS